MRYLILILILGLSVPAGAEEGAGTGRALHPLTLEDVFRMEGIGRAMVDGSGQAILFERIRPYESLPDYGFGTYAYARSGHEIWRLDLTRNDPPERLSGQRPDAHVYLHSQSPDGRYLSLVELHEGRAGLALLDLRTGEMIRPQPAPALSRLGAQEPAWVSGGSFVYAALPDGAQPLETSIRMATGAARDAAWRDAWRGDRVTATEIRIDQGGLRLEGRLVRVDLRTGDAHILAEGGYEHLSVSPDGRFLAALALSRGSDAYPRDKARLDARHHGLHLIDLETGTVRAAAPGLDIQSAGVSWSANGAKLAFFAVRPGETRAQGRHHVLDVAQGDVMAVPHPGLDLVSERERGLLQRPERAYLLQQGLAVFARPHEGNDPGAAGFTYRDIAPSDLGRPDWYLLSPGQRPQNLSVGLGPVSPLPARIGADTLDLVTEDGIHRVGPGGPAERLTPDGLSKLDLYRPGGFLAWRGSLPPAPGAALILRAKQVDGDAILLLEQSVGDRRVWKRQSAGPASARILTVGPKGHILLAHDRAPSGIDLILKNPDGEARILLSLNRHLEAVDWGRWQSVSYDVPRPGAPGEARQLTSCVLMPPGQVAGRPFPILFDIYPGTQPGCDGDRPALSYPDPYTPHLWAARGYAYARIAAPRDLIRNESGPIARLPMLVSSARTALIGAGLADPDRIVLYGFSQGAAAALHVAAESEGLAALIAQNGWADFVSHALGPPGIYRDLHPGMLVGNMKRYEADAGSDFGLGQDLFAAPEAYLRNSPVLMAGEMDFPVLLVHTDMDVFPHSQFDEMYTALARFGHPVRYVWYAGEGHGLSSPANIRDLWERMMDFLDTSLALSPVSGEASRPDGL